jgi:hypothetical protein
MSQGIKGQINTRAGRPGQEGVRPIAHGTYNLGSRGEVAAMRAQLGELMDAASDAAGAGFVTEVSVMVYRADAPEQVTNDNPELLGDVI